MEDAPQKQSSQVWLPERYAHNAGFVSELGMPVLALLAPESGEDVLDLGCGDGTLMAELAARGCHVIGVDQSVEQIAAVRELGLDGRALDAQHLPFERAFDAVFSNAALHWMPRIEEVIAGVARALRPGGRFVAECGGSGNVATIRAELVAALERRGVPGESRVPWHFRSAEQYRGFLERACFQVDTCTQFARPTELPGDLRAWLTTFAEDFARALPAGDRAGYFDEVRANLASRLRDERGVWVADYVRVRFAATKPRSAQPA